MRKIIYADSVFEYLIEEGQNHASKYGFHLGDTIKFSPSQVAEIIEKMPPIEVPEQKTGEWIWDKDGIDWGLGAWRCSECGGKPETWWESDRRYNPLKCAGGKFCGNCGVKMKGYKDE